MPVVVVKGGAVLLALLYMFLSSMAGITLDEMTQTNERVNSQDIEQIKEEIEELIEDYTEFARKYMPEWLKDNDLKGKKPTEEDLAQFKEDALHFYIYQEEFRNVIIEDETFDYMVNQLPEDAQTNMNRRIKLSGDSEAQYIIRNYIKTIIEK